MCNAGDFHQPTVRQQRHQASRPTLAADRIVLAANNRCRNRDLVHVARRPGNRGQARVRLASCNAATGQGHAPGQELPCRSHCHRRLPRRRALLSRRPASLCCGTDRRCVVQIDRRGRKRIAREFVDGITCSRERLRASLPGTGCSAALLYANLGVGKQAINAPAERGSRDVGCGACGAPG
jgi:hypothetical protein